MHCEILFVPDISFIQIFSSDRFLVSFLEFHCYSTLKQYNATKCTCIKKSFERKFLVRSFTRKWHHMLTACFTHPVIRTVERRVAKQKHSSWAAHRFLQVWSVCRGFLCGCAIATELRVRVANYWLKLRVKGGLQRTTGGILLLGSWPLRDAWLWGA